MDTQFSLNSQLLEILNHGNIKAMQQFLDDGLDINYELYGEPLLLWAAGNDHPDMVEFLIMRGADVNKLSTTGNYPLNRAVRRQNLPIVRTLIQQKANTDTSDSLGGETALHNVFCTQYPNRGIIKLLLEAKADLTVQDWAGKTPLEYDIQGIYRKFFS